MNSTKKRGILATAGALLTAAALALGSGTAASAASQPVPDQSTVVITKLAQPATPGTAADGTPQDVSGATPIKDVVFDYYLVDGTAAGQTNDIGTNAGQQAAAAWTAATAPTSTTKTDSFTATGADGVTTATLPRGLYVVKESATPAGVTAAVDFLLAVPLTDPDDSDAWLDTIHVYPKNAQIGATKTVSEGTLVVGGDVTWTITTDIPRVANAAGTAFVAPDYFEIADTLTDAELALSTTASPAITVTAGGTALTVDTHYTLQAVAGTGVTTHQIVFTPAGRTALATAVNDAADAEVVVTLVTTVKQATEIANAAKIYPDHSSKTNEKPLTTNEVETKFGSYRLIKDSSDAEVEDLSGAEFRVYATEAAAKAGGAGYVTATDNAGTARNLWTTDASGNVTIEGLRYSAWANGAAVDTSDPAYQAYWLVETKALAGHQLLAEPVKITIDGDSVSQTTQIIVNQSTSGAFVLPLTGGTGVGFLMIGGIVLLAGVLVVARLRRRAEAAAE
ncbi:SpaH/EbpB family LPXTG-anchored major pilin [Microbacterium invictum]|uniref:LPXTG-motif cell wall-anchored protein n=1 Tax=Microbacterium invictum TaxID=515415 RepID=A0AA40SQ13_9MICO|nr:MULTISPECIES: SpaH/EbpB family LPXTG-anchored major pilin [Microbacterium]MBB4140142.1 LPXTG-motif cell wall-anchored protein [Microbacterium invictum]